MFKLDFNDTFEGGLKDGQYEVVVTNASERQTQSGTNYIEIVLAVRNDVQQPSQNALIFHKIWKSKETGKYNLKSLNTIGKYLQLQEDKAYNSLDDVLKDFVRKMALVTVKNETSEYNGKEYNNVNVKRWEVTKFPTLAHQFKNAVPNTDAFTSVMNEVNNDDLPF